MITRTFAELVRDLQTRRSVADRPPVLLLGAGASVDAGIGAMPELFAFFGCTTFEEFCSYIATTTAPERYRYLSQFLQTLTPAAVSPGYHALAALCAQNYFDLVLTTNMDPLLDDALAAARLWRRDYLLLVNGVIRPDRLAPLLGGPSPRVKIVKLHGDLFHRFMAWTVPEMDTFLTDIAADLEAAVDGRDFLVVGYSLRDAQVRALVESAGGSVWFTHPSAVPAHLEAVAGPVASRFRAVVAPECAFEQFFPALTAALKVDRVEGALSPAPPPAMPREVSPLMPDPLPHAVVAAPLAGPLQRPKPSPKVPAAPAPAPPPPAPVVRRAQTLDDVMAATFAVATADGVPGSTAFLLAEPRVIVCDRYAAASLVVDGAVTLLGTGGQRFKATVRATATAHPFGPMLLDVPASLQVPGIGLAKTGMALDAVMQVVVTAGERTGIGTGTVSALKAPPQTISGIPSTVKNLAALACLVAPGSSGAPVVDRDLAVAGFVVAANMDPDHPVCLVYPAAGWRAMLLV